MNRLTISKALENLQAEKKPFKELFNHGSLSVEIYKPEGIDHQTPHSRDEVYVVASGSGYFVNGESRERFEQGKKEKRKKKRDIQRSSLSISFF